MPSDDGLTQDVLDHLVELLEKKDFKGKLVKELNEAVDIPMINEKTEKKVFETIYKLIIKNIKKLDLDLRLIIVFIQ